MLQDWLAWTTFAAGVITFLIVAGPMSARPFFPDRCFVLAVCISLVGASVLRVVSSVDPYDQHARQYSHSVMLVSRLAMVVLGTVWLYMSRKAVKPQ